MCTKNNNRDKLLLTSLADQIENKKRREEILGGKGKSYVDVEGGNDNNII